MLLFTDTREYRKVTNRLCDRSHLMSSKNVNDAKKECDSKPSCYMFSSTTGGRKNGKRTWGKFFHSCEKNAKTYWQRLNGRDLYQALNGNRNYMQFEYF